jgi:D-glycero-alpha-D-manno-heptose-7-phosphate kinase
VNLFSFLKDGNVLLRPVNNNNINNLLENSLLFYTNIQRSADEVLLDQKNSYLLNEKNLLEIKDMASEFYEIIHDSKFHLNKLGELLHKSWISKRTLSKKVSNKKIDTYYETAIKNGAIGGKILGAGGGGFLFLIAPKKYHSKIIIALNELENVKFKFEPIGTRTLLNF